MYTTIGLIVAGIGLVSLILKIWLRNKENSPYNQNKIVNDIFKEEERRRAERMARNELKTMAANDSDILDELERLRQAENNDKKVP